MESREVIVGGRVHIGGGNPIVVQTMCNTHTNDVEATVAQCLELAAAGAELIRITVPGMQDVPHIAEIKKRLRDAGCLVPLVADIHFSSETAIAVASIVEKVRINPGNFHKDHDKAREQFGRFLEVCKENGTAIRIGLNHGSLGAYITEQYGNTPFAMAKAAMEWIQMCLDAEFYQVVVSLKASNTVVVVEAYRELVKQMEAAGVRFPIHIGVTEAGNGLEGRIKSCVALSTLLEEGIGDTIRVSLTEPPVAELPVAQFLAWKYSSAKSLAVPSEKSATLGTIRGRYPQLPKGDPDGAWRDERCEVSEGVFRGELPATGGDYLEKACYWGPKLLRREVDEIEDDTVPDNIKDEIMQAARRKFSHPEYVACPGCGRTMYDLQGAFEEVKRRTSHLQGMVIAVMGCIVNGPGEMADADWGYVGEGGGKVSIYKKGQPVLRHVPDSEAIDRLLELIESTQQV